MATTKVDPDFFRENGYALARGLFAKEDVTAVLADVQRIEDSQKARDSRNLRLRFKLQEEASVLDAIDPIIDWCASVERLAKSEALLHSLRILYDDEPILFKDKLILKKPGVPGYPWHQDYIAWPAFPESFLTAVVAIDPSNAQSGAIEILAGSHKRGYLSARDGDFHDLSLGTLGDFSPVRIDLEAGDVLFFGAYTVHGSKANASVAPRRHLYLSYNAKNDGGDQRKAHYRYFLHWLKKRYAEFGAPDVFFE